MSNEQIREIVQDFQQQILSFSYEVQDRFEKYVQNEQNGIYTEGKALSELISYYKNSNFDSKTSQDYILHLENQINLLNTFFELTETLR